MSSIHEAFKQILARIFAASHDLKERIGTIFNRFFKRAPEVISEKTDEDYITPTARRTVPKPKNIKPIRRRSRQKVYRLKGYTTVAKVNRKRQAERQQRLLRRVLLLAIVIVALILMYNYINPFKNIAEWYRFFGISSLAEIITGKTTPGTTAGITIDSTVLAIDTADLEESRMTD